jgi:hypothetical protein
MNKKVLVDICPEISACYDTNEFYICLVNAAICIGPRFAQSVMQFGAQFVGWDTASWKCSAYRRRASREFPLAWPYMEFMSAISRARDIRLYYKANEQISNQMNITKQKISAVYRDCRNTWQRKGIPKFMTHSELLLMRAARFVILISSEMQNSPITEHAFTSGRKLTGIFLHLNL